MLNAIQYRHLLQQREKPWYGATWVPYAVLVIVAPSLFGLLSRLDDWRWDNAAEWLPFYLAVYAQLFFFCARGLFSNLNRIAKEKDKRTFEVLLSTRLSKRDLVWGQLSTTTLPGLLEIPLLSAFLGWIYKPGWEQWIGITLLSAALWVAYSFLGMAISLYARSSLQATSLGSVWLVWAFFLSFIADLGIFGDSRSNELVLANSFNPLVMVQHIINENSYPFGNGSLWVGGLATAGLAILSLAYFVRNLGRPQTRRKAGRSQLSWMARWCKDPILYREFRFGAQQLIYPALWLGPFLYAGLGGLRGRPESACGLAMFLHVLYFGIQAARRSITAFSSERERRTLDSLLGTRLSPTELWRGKLKAVFYPIALEFVMFSPLFFLGSTWARKIWPPPSDCSVSRWWTCYW